jgi:hypothetical protein
MTYASYYLFIFDNTTHGLASWNISGHVKDRFMYISKHWFFLTILKCFFFGYGSIISREPKWHLRTYAAKHIEEGDAKHIEEGDALHEMQVVKLLPRHLFSMKKINNNLY